MKSFNSSWKVGLAFGVGLLVGAWFFRVKPAQAQAARVSVEVTKVNTLAAGGASVTGSQVVGFSCVRDVDRDYTECYIASR